VINTALLWITIESKKVIPFNLLKNNKMIHIDVTVG